ncbi:hypothetical protein [Rathayibacter sp. VKM Ac-2801]|uniref:hypothetical protein n=1 Tax=Rathayibacter sp. VKM Ac-2801 TaxID=2609255 RepID=UPI00131FC900|nr:hypothetical protein [Rathayibacter sp. VKM Ac-2801]QHC71835.1 hypothetical protein GSU45_16525 [Rathayibacter sp. VKM Ac-2801]
MTRRLAAAGAVALLTAAAIVTATAPSDDDVQTPLARSGGVGERVESRTVAVTVHGAVLARELAVEGREDLDTTSPGVWLVVDLTAVCRLSSCAFDESELRVDGRRFAPATLVPFPSFVQQSPSAGLPYRQSALFELPRGSASGEAELVVQTGDTGALDSVAVVRLPLPERIDDSAAVGPVRLVQAAP